MANPALGMSSQMDPSSHNMGALANVTCLSPPYKYSVSKRLIRLATSSVSSCYIGAKQVLLPLKIINIH